MGERVLGLHMRSRFAVIAGALAVIGTGFAGVYGVVRTTGNADLADIATVRQVRSATDAPVLGDSYTAKLALTRFSLPLSKSTDAKIRLDLIRSIQAGLAERGFDPGPADGQRRPATTMAISAYQKKVGLAVTGEPSANLLDHIILTWRLSPVSEDAATATARQLVKNIQMRLARLGYAPGKTSGVINGETRQAIAKYERDRGLPVTGELSAKLVLKLSQPTRRAPL